MPGLPCERAVQRALAIGMEARRAENPACRGSVQRTTARPGGIAHTKSAIPDDPGTDWDAHDCP